jgi:hypothetical protein
MPTAVPEAKREELLKLVSRIRSGKQISTDRYLHFENSEAVMVLAAISNDVTVPAGANVLRIRKVQIELSMSFSQYADFYDQPFPKLVWSEHHDLISGSVTRRSEGQNPAILHRKELLLNVDDPRRISSARLTEALVTNGLLPTREFIGRHEHWQQYLYRRGFEILDGNLTALGGS